MKKYLPNKLLIFIIIIWIFTCVSGASLAAETTDENKAPENKAEDVVANVGHLENVLLAKLPGKERIQLVVSQQPVIDVKSKINGNFLIKLENMMVPESLCRPLGEGELNNIINVTPSQQLIKGKQWVYLTIDIKKIVPYAIRQEGQNLFIDFNVSGLGKKKTSASSKITAKKKVIAKVSAETAKKTDDIAESEEANLKPIKKEAVKRNRIISIDFQDADIRSVLRLMAEYGDISIVSSDEVKGNVTLSMKNVPWDQALDTILEVNSLTKKQTDNIITVTTLERKKKDEADKVRAYDDKNKADDERKAREQKMLAEKGLLKQVLIEAKIVEASEDFVRIIGVQWGFGTQNTIHAGSTYGLGVMGGSNTVSTNPVASTYPSEIGMKSSTGSSLSMAAVNFPAAVASPSIGLVFGGAHGFLETQLAALETNGTGKLISAPKVVTMEGIKAIIKQGAEVPYTTPASGTSPATVSFKEALLSLEVTPKITDEGKISMEIKASNDSPDYQNEVQGNPPIKKSEVESKVVISDGDTVVIGGVMATNEVLSDSGWPFLQKIPVLGWLFKTEDKETHKKQLLIFVTPKILKGDTFKESAEKIIN
ncbi:MAG: secretin and TonB N-terminal domain-containing protein [Smithella sp.]|jgi:type IV pilus assembly protein PilQ